MKLRIRYKTPPRATTTTAQPSRLRIRSRPARVLDFDIENRPLSYLGSDFTTGEVTAIAWAWVDTPEDVTVHLLGESELPDILQAFRAVYEAADIVTGHYILGHDLPMINGAMMEFKLPPLPNKRIRDTKIHLMKSKGISLSQESLGAMWRIEQAKVQMNQAKWRAANRLTPEGLAEVKARVVGDVRQHIEILRTAMACGYLCPATEWRSGTARPEAYVP
jgi:hypothetical protein